MYKKFCELCESKIEPDDNFYYFALKKGIFPVHRGDLTMDICEECRNKIKVFVKGLEK